MGTRETGRRGAGRARALLGALIVGAASAPSPGWSGAGAGAAGPETWPAELDAVRAAPGNHQVIFEDAEMRVLSVTVRPGESEPLHDHRWPSILVIDSLPRLVDHDASGAVIPRRPPLPPKVELPLVLRMPPQAAHWVLNAGDRPFHAIRIEYKKGYPPG